MLEEEVIIEKDFSGVIRRPDFLFSDTPYKDQLSPPTQKIVLIIANYGEDYNSKRLQSLASALSMELGMYSLRVKLPLYNTEHQTEALEKGAEYISSAVAYITRVDPDTDLSLWSIIGYSEGAATMFAWAIKQNDLYYSEKAEDRQQALVIPNLINCSSKFYLDELTSSNWTQFISCLEEYENMYAPVRCGKSKKHNGLDFLRLCQMTDETSVLSIYGSQDEQGLCNGSHFANTLSKRRYSHHLSIIPQANHNFQGKPTLGNNTENDMHDYNYKAIEVMIDYLKPENEIQRFFSISLQSRDFPRWKLIKGISNFRDIGGWRIDKPRFSDSNKLSFVKLNTVFRCASMDNVCRDSGLKKLHDLGISTIFDFRTKSEAKRCVKDDEIERFGLTRVHCPFELEEKKNPADILESFTNLLTSWYTYSSIYENMLVQSTDVYKKIFEFIRDEVPKGKKFIFHCSAGKDRTGIVCMLILLFMGVNKSLIAREYSLTAIGLKPDFETIRRKYLAGIGIFRKHEKYAKFESNLRQGRIDWKVEEDGFNNLISSRSETMLATITVLDKKFGGIDNYLSKYVGLTEEDLKTIYSNLVEVEYSSQIE